MKSLRFLIFIALFFGAGCSGLFGEFPEFEGRDIGDDADVGDDADIGDVGDDADEPLEYDLIVEGPPSEVVAGESFVVVVRLVDDRGNDLEMADVDIEVRVSEGEFAGGGEKVNASSDGAGRVEYSLSIEVARSGLFLVVTSDHEEFSHASVSTAPFNVVAAQARAEFSAIYGEKNAEADGEDEAQIAIELFDEFQNPLVGEVPEFDASGEGNELGDCSPTNQQGVATCTMTSTAVGTKSLSITEPISLEDGGEVEFLPSCDPGFDGPFGGGFGDPDTPYLICTRAHLNNIGNALNQSFLLRSDLDLQAFALQMIGDENDPFTGQFDGGGFAIRNLTINEPDANYVGLFRVISEEATVANLVLLNVEISGHSSVGGLAGQNQGTISDSFASGDVAGISQVGGLVGRNESGSSIVNSNAEGSVTGTGQEIGGLVGRSEETIDGSGADVDVHAAEASRVGGLVGMLSGGRTKDSMAEGSVNGGQRVGGLVGWGNGPIQDSHAHGDVTGESEVGGLVGLSSHEISGSSATGAVEGSGQLVGGLVGDNQDHPINDSYATGNVISSSRMVGGLVGRNQSEVNDSYATGNVDGELAVGGLIGRNADDKELPVGSGNYYTVSFTNRSYATGDVTGDNEVGGLVGRNGGEIRQSYSIGTVTGDSPDSDEAGDGGFVGRNTDTGTIEESYSAAHEVISTSLRSGGFFGTNENVGGITGSYWDVRSRSEEQSGDVSGVDTSFFADSDHFSGWDFDEVWEIGTTPAPDEEQRPILQWQQ